MHETPAIKSIIPCNKFLRYFGLCPFYQLQSTGTVLRLVVIGYSFLLHGFLFYTILILNIKELTKLVTSEFNFDIFVHIAKNINLLFGYLIIPISYWRWSSKLTKYFNKWLKLYEALSTNCNPYRTNIEIDTDGTLKVQLMIIFFGTTFLLAIFHQLESIYSYGLIVMFGMLSFLWNRACDATLETLGQFQWQLKNSGNGINVFDFRIEDLISSWILLSKVMKSSCRLYSILLFLSLQSMTLLVMFSVNTLFIQAAQKKFDIQDYFHSIVIMILAAGNVYAICNKSHCTEQQIRSVIHNEVLGTGTFLSNTEKLIQIKQMLYIVRITTPSICLFNFISINRPLMVNLLSVVVTYLVVLIQFQITNRPSISNFTSNATNTSLNLTANLSHV